MNTTKKLICILTAGAALGAASPVFADSSRGPGDDHNRHSAQYRDHDRNGYRDFDRHVYRNYDRPHLVVAPRHYVVQRPHFVEQPVYYSQPAPMGYIGMGAIIGALIGGIIDSQ